MGKFTNLFGAAATREPDGEIKSHGQTDFPVCKFCGGDLIVVRADFDAKSRGSNKSIACKQCGRDQAQE